MACGPKLALLLSLYLLLRHAAAVDGGLCGPQGSGATCPGLQCCGPEGRCGITDFHCGGGCQVQFGSCDQEAHRVPSPEVMIDILVVEPGDAGMFAAVNTTALAGFDPGSQWGTVPMDQVFALCETFMYGGNRSVAVTISSGNYSLVTGMTVQAAVGCEADDEDAPLQAWLLDNLGRDFFLSPCDSQHSTSCLVYSGESQHPKSTWGLSARPETMSPPHRTYKSGGAYACGPNAYYLCPFPTCCDSSSWFCSHEACGTPACHMLYTASGNCYRSCGTYGGVEYTCNTAQPCCSSSGWCVTGMQYCGSFCQPLYGYNCHGPPSPVPRSPSPAPRPPQPDPDNNNQGDIHVTVSSGKVRVPVIVAPTLGSVALLILVVSVIVVIMRKLNPKEPVQVEVRV